MTNREIKSASDQAEDWLNLFPLVRSEERDAFIEWMRASPVHMRAFASAHILGNSVDEFLYAVASELDDPGLERLTREAREAIAREGAAGGLKEEEIEEQTVAVSRQELIEDAGDWLTALTNSNGTEQEAFDAWLGTSSDHREILAWARQAWERMPEGCKGRDVPQPVVRRQYRRALRIVRGESVLGFLSICADSYPGGLTALNEALEAETGAALRSLDPHPHDQLSELTQARQP